MKSSLQIFFYPGCIWSAGQNQTINATIASGEIAGLRDGPEITCAAGFIQ